VEDPELGIRRKVRKFTLYPALYKKMKFNNKIYDTFIYETMNGEFMVSDPDESDQVIMGGPFQTREEAIEAFDSYAEKNGMILVER
jgi:hypothetical protein